MSLGKGQWCGREKELHQLNDSKIILMILYWLLNILFATYYFLIQLISSQSLELCNPTGELPAPELFHKAGSVDNVSLLCMLSTKNNITRFFYCKDKTLAFGQKPISNMAIYTFNIAQHSIGQYSCGYEHKEGLNQQKSALSPFWNLTVPPEDNFYSGEHDGINRISSLIGKNSWIILGCLSFAILILAALTYLVKKVCCLLKKKKSNPQTIPTDNGKIFPIRNNRKHLRADVLYATLEGFPQTEMPP